MRLKLCSVMITIAAAWLAGCGNGSSNANVAGNYSLTATSDTPGRSLSADLVLKQSGNVLSGTYTCTSETPDGCPSTSALQLTGSISGAEVTLQVSLSCSLTSASTVTFSGAVDSAGNTISGTYDQPASGTCSSGDMGSWSATQQVQP